MPYTQFNGATVPAPDPGVVAAAPPTTDPTAVQAFIREYVPDTWQGSPVGFGRTYEQTMTCATAFPAGGCQEGLLPGFDLEMWGLPTSLPAVDPNNHNFVYQRFQRGVMMYDASTGVTEGMLLADYLKSILTGRDLPADLAAQAQGSPVYLQYWPGYQAAVRDPVGLPATDLGKAFTPNGPQGQGTIQREIAALNGCAWNTLQFDAYFDEEPPFYTMEYFVPAPRPGYAVPKQCLLAPYNGQAPDYGPAQVAATAAVGFLEKNRLAYSQVLGQNNYAVWGKAVEFQVGGIAIPGS
jgi:hypothetical protein